MQLPTSFAVYYPQGAKLGDSETFVVDIANWSAEKVAAVFAFGLKEFANNRTGGKVKDGDNLRSKTATEIVEICVQKTFDDWTPGVGGGTRADPFVLEARERIHTHLNLKRADIAEATKGMDREAIVKFMAGRVAKMIGDKPKEIARVVAGHVEKIEKVLALRAE